MPSTTDCVYKLTTDDLSNEEAKEFTENVKGQLDTDGTIVFDFDDKPRDITELSVTANEDVELVLVAVSDEGEQSPQDVQTSKGTSESTEFAVANVKKVIIKRKDGSELNPDDIASVEVVACLHLKTTSGKPAPSTTGKPSEVTTQLPGAKQKTSGLPEVTGML